MAASELLGLKDVAAKLRVHPATVVRWLETGKVSVKKKKTSRGYYAFTSEDLRKLERFQTSDPDDRVAPGPIDEPRDPAVQEHDADRAVGL